MTRADILMATALAGLACTTAAMAGPLPGDELEAGGRACYSLPVRVDTPLRRLLVEIHKEAVNPGDPPVIWARVYGEKQGEARPGFNFDGCSAYEPGDLRQANRLGHLRCGFSCDGGTLEISQAPGGIAIRPDNLFLRSCGVAEDAAGGFLVTSSDLGEAAVMSPVDDGECRNAMAPGEKMIEDAENAID